MDEPSEDVEGGTLTVGCTVRIFGLVKKPELNGKEGMIISNDEAKGRWHVQLVGGSDGVQGKLSLKGSNLEVTRESTFTGCV